MIAIRILALAFLVPGLIPGPSVVEMTSYMTFQPRELSVMVGEVVVWKNTAEMPHTVNSDPANCKGDEAREWVKVPAGATPFYSGEMKPGDEFRIRFEVPGIYQYLCVYHENQMMRGTVIVSSSVK